MKWRMTVSVSIVVPVYNVEQYISACLDSLYQQNQESMEVIFVDDCGKDRSMDMVRNYIGAHGLDNWKIVSHTRNRGLSAARNSGLCEAHGDYVLFLDSDDTLTKDALSLLTAPLQDKDYDCIIGGVDDGTLSNCSLQSRRIEGNEEVLHSYANGEWYVMAWNKLCRREFLVNNNLYFEEGLLHEDVVWSFKLACTAQSICVLYESTYIYNIRENSIMTSLSIEKDLTIYIKAFDHIVDYIKDRGLQKNKSVYALFYGKRAGIMYSLIDKKEINLLAKYYPQIRRQSYISPIKAFFSVKISFLYILRDLHYILPLERGVSYLRMFYSLFYRLRGKRVEGAVWK